MLCSISLISLGHRPAYPEDRGIDEGQCTATDIKGIAKPLRNVGVVDDVPEVRALRAVAA